MSECKAGLPPVQIVMSLGHYPGTTEARIKKIVEEATATLRSFHPVVGRFHTQRFREVKRFVVIAEKHEEFYNEDTMDLDGAAIVLMPSEHTASFSDRREWIRTAPEMAMLPGSYRYNIDADFTSAAINAYYGVGNFDPTFSDALSMSGLVGHHLQAMKDWDLDFAGFRCDRYNRPAFVPGMYTSFEHRLSRGERIYNFKESCTIESWKCPGKYPKGWDFHEGAFRILDTIRSGGKTALFGPSVIFKMRPPNTYENAKDEYVSRLIKVFGKELVLRGRGNGLGLSTYGKDRNKKRRGLR